MAGFNSYDAIIAAITQSGLGQEVQFQKTSPVAFTTAGNIFSSWAFTGIPAAGTNTASGGSTAATMVNVDSSTSGALPLVSPTSASGLTPFVSALGAYANAAIAGSLILIDRIAETGTLSTTAPGTCTITMPGGGWGRYTDGVGVMAFVESLTTAPTAASQVTLSYTNSDSISTRTSGVVTVSTGTASNYRAMGNTGPFFSLQGSDKGIKSIESISIAAQNATSIGVVVCKPLAIIPLGTAYQYLERDLVLQAPKLPQLKVTSADKTACLQFLIIAGANVTPTINGTVSTVTG